MNIDIEKLAEEFLYVTYRYGAYYGYADELKQFAEAYCQEKQRQQEPVAKIKAQWSCPDNLGKKHRERYVQFKNGIIPQEGTELFTYPPDAAKVHDKRVGELEAKNRELSASINDLREALEFYADKNEWSGHPWKLIFNSRHIDADGFEVAQQALSKTPAQSLREHDNKVIEMVASAWTCDCDDCPDNIRTLKGNT